MLQTLLFLAVVAICPLMMVFMMRGMGHHHGDSGSDEVGARDARIAQLESQVAALQGTRPDAGPGLASPTVVHQNGRIPGVPAATQSLAAAPAAAVRQDGQ